MIGDRKKIHAILPAEALRITHGDDWNPHHYLGLHEHISGKVIRLWRPGAKKVHFELKGHFVEAKKIQEAGLFEYEVGEDVHFRDYRVYHQNGLLAHDPYAFLPTFGEQDGYFFNKGTHYQIYNVLGARLTSHQGCQGVKFAVWAPNARRVSIVGDFNYWDGRINPMRSMGRSGVWELFIPGLVEGEHYKFEIKTQFGDLRIKADPYAYQAQLRPNTASVVANIDKYTWHDKAWIERRKAERHQPHPLTIYELHLGSWRQNNGQFLNYREIAIQLAIYCKEMGFSHVELMPVAEHPLDESWGYQVSGFYAVTSRFGSAEDFQFFVDHLHKHDIGVIIDWVPAHFPTDDFSLGRFDGTALYENYEQGFHPHWHTYIFDYGRKEVSNFLIANALFWFDKMHIDGLRVDAVASMLYLDYGREHGDWRPNLYGGNENLDAIEFLKHLNSIVHQKFPGVLMIAEESTSFAGVSKPTDSGGLGFDYKWNMGWMNDTLYYFRKDPLYRRHHHNELTFGLLYAFSENFISVLSHDEIVHGKRSLLDKMPGDYWQKFANLRLLYSYMICQPGKKLLFMGGEIGQWNEWYCKEEIHWQLLTYPSHQGIQNLVRSLNHFYLQHPQLWELDSNYQGFEWVDFGDVDNSVIVYRRKGSQRALYSELLCVHNFTPTYLSEYFIRFAHFKQIVEVFNTDEISFGGSGKTNQPINIIYTEDGVIDGFTLALAPLATMIFEITF